MTIRIFSCFLILLALPMLVSYHVPEEPEPQPCHEIIEIGIGITRMDVCYHPDSTYTPFIENRIKQINEQSNNIN